jgi:hypothetical protein
MIFVTSIENKDFRSLTGTLQMRKVRRAARKLEASRLLGEINGKLGTGSGLTGDLNPAAVGLHHGFH